MCHCSGVLLDIWLMLLMTMSGFWYDLDVLFYCFPCLWYISHWKSWTPSHVFLFHLFAEQKEGGTQLKLIITYSDEGQALFKPMRYVRLWFDFLLPKIWSPSLVYISREKKYLSCCLPKAYSSFSELFKDKRPYN